MSLVRPVDLGSTLHSVHAICDQLEKQARGEQPIVTDPKVLGAWLQTNGITLGKLATSYTDAPPGYVVGSGALAGADVPAANNSEALSVLVGTASSFSADGSRSVNVLISLKNASNAGVSTPGTLKVSLYDNGVFSQELMSLTMPTSAVGSTPPLVVVPRLTPSAGAHVYTVRAYTTVDHLSVGAGQICITLL